MTEGKKATYTAALNSTVARVPAREYVFGLTEANTKTWKIGEGGRKADVTVFDPYGRDVRELNENGKPLLGFAEDNKLALLNTPFQSPYRSQGQTRLDFVFKEQAGCQLACCALMSASTLWRCLNRITISCTQISVSRAGPHRTGRGKVPRKLRRRLISAG